jgi:membrane protein
MRLIWDVICEFADDRCIELAAALAFYMILSLAPLLVLMITIVGIFVEPQNIEGKVAETANTILGPHGAEQLKTVTGSGSLVGGSFWAKFANLAVLVVGATGVMLQLQAALNRIWDAPPAPRKRSLVARFLLDRVLSVGMILSLAFLLFLSLAVAPLVLAATRPLSDLLGQQIMRHVIDEGGTFLTVALLFTAMFKTLPRARVSWIYAGLGAAVTAVLFLGGKVLIGLYLGHQRLGSTYGAASSVVFILLWTYYSSLIFLFGAELTHVWETRSAKSDTPAAKS